MRPSLMSNSILRCAMAMVLPAVVVCRGEDSDELRYYLGLRGADTNPMTEIHDEWGFSLGANLNEYVGVELAVDSYEKFVDVGNYGGNIGEYHTWAFVPEVRLRYPLLKKRLVPYLIAGVGGGFTEFNGRKPRGFGLEISEDHGTFLASIGGGIEYFIADNIALGIEVKYLAGNEQTIKVDGIGYDFSATAPLMTFGMRLFYPELHPKPLAESLPEVPNRLYLTVIAGGALPVHEEVFSGVKAEPETTAYFGTFDKVFGFGAGMNFGRYVSAEIVVQGYEMILQLEGVGEIGEYATYAVVPQARFRWPFLEGRVVPYAVGGVGLAYGEFNDRKPAGEDLSINGNQAGVAATIGGGVEYFLMSNIALNFETTYRFSRLQTLQIDDGPERKGNLDSLMITCGLRIYLAAFKK
jgi:opacity protein-like surface antigen